jgi:uncharacterized membrane protein YhdT
MEIILILVYVVFCFAAANIAGCKYRSGPGWFILTALFPPLLIILLTLAPLERARP